MRNATEINLSGNIRLPNNSGRTSYVHSTNSTPGQGCVGWEFVGNKNQMLITANDANGNANLIIDLQGETRSSVHRLLFRLLPFEDST